MGIFETIKNAIFGHAAATAPANAAASASGTTQPARGDSPTSATGAAPSATPASAGKAPVDVEAVLTSLAQKSGQPSNWRTSIVDLMKLVGLDSSLQNRKQLAQELGYRGDTADSASMNIWLHKQVMEKLAENGGQVPASLRAGA